MKNIFIIFFISVFFAPVSGQIKPGETLVFAASYEISGLMTNIAQVTMQTENISTSKNTFLHLSLQAETFAKWDSFFKVRDLYESYVNPANLKPSMYKRNVLEGNYTKTEKYIFNPDGKTVNSTSRRYNRAEVKKTFNKSIESMDVVTLGYKLRSVDFSKLKPGQSVSYTIVFDEKEYPVSLKLMGKEVVSAGNLGKKECYKLSISAKTNKLKGKDNNLIWLSTDKKIPCKIKFSIPVGVGQLTLSKATGI
ncbi:MAG TPA: DUF3108 domain-containing protein [Paludibacter sp.]|nr:DUF3108 domain-containing protein [Paludibacter sp.]